MASFSIRRDNNYDNGRACERDKESAEIKNLVESLDSLLAWSQEWLKKRFAHNPHLREMIESIDFTIQCLAHEQSETRQLALDVFKAFFSSSVDIRNYLVQIENLTFKDPDIEIRQNAVAVFARIASRSPVDAQRAMGGRIAAVILDASGDMNFRKSAYLALCTLSSDYNIRMRSCDQVRFPEDVDWKYVRSWE
jgi:hypothetical protein